MELKKFIHDLKVVNYQRLNKRHFLLELLPPEKLSLILPGQFAQALVENSPATFLRRPFSIHSVDYGKNTLKLLIQIKGEGTRRLSRLKEGDALNLIYPLGNSFSIPNTKDVLLVGGGCGVAPLLFLAQFLSQRQIHPTILLGFRTREEVSEIETYSKYGNVLITTDDGSEGEKGLVVNHSVFNSEKLSFKKIFCCGPLAMMKAVAEIARKREISCEVSLENTMACGFGVCLCCITPTVNGNERVCVEGPVFNINRLKWS
ncbi:MAG: dihydroorotate dehydrogenase electron transfer subunit [Bacteroidota bacterium]